MSTAILLLLVHCAGIPAVLGQGQDLTRQPEAAGTSVVLASIGLIGQTGVFPGDNLFLRRLAYAETRDGVDITTYRYDCKTQFTIITVLLYVPIDRDIVATMYGTCNHV